MLSPLALACTSDHTVLPTSGHTWRQRCLLPECHQRTKSGSPKERLPVQDWEKQGQEERAGKGTRSAWGRAVSSSRSRTTRPPPWGDAGHAPKAQ